MKGLLQKRDLVALERLERFLPERIFDAHLHISPFQIVIPDSHSYWHLSEDAYGYDDYLTFFGQLFPFSALLGGNLIVAPHPLLKEDGGKYVSQILSHLTRELDRHPDCVGEIPVFPSDSVSDIERRLTHDRIRGLKCYHIYSKIPTTTSADIDDYLPESAWQVANARGLCITLHLVKEQSLADPVNLATIQKKASEYPHARLILAHCGRGFAPWTVRESASLLRRFSNIWFDVSSVCEPIAIMDCIRQVGVGRVLWGSDFPVATMRGKAISLSDGFYWLYEDTLRALGEPIPPTDPIAIEELRAMIDACRLLDLSREDVDRVFCQNALELFR